MLDALRLVVAMTLLSGSTAALAAGDPSAGKVLFLQCAACHTVEANGADNVGPNLNGFLGKAAATNRKKFQYSDALRKAKLVWDDATLDAWIKSPAGLVPGSKMEFVGLTKKDKRLNVIAYLKQATSAPAKK